MTLTTAHTHEELLTLARKVQAAASDGDSDRLERASVKLYDALLAHVGAERPDLVQRQATFARNEMARSSSSLVWRFRQAM
jgi:hypothetical protein